MQNELIHESSIYLQQHKNHNIYWQPWSENIFKIAQELNKPVFLSIGYSSCHWCHVMSHECFEHNEVADILNNYFIAIKVDKEERPDIDNIHMSVCQMLNGSGGWPMSLFLTPEKKVFWAGTYLPKDKFIKLATNINNLWQSQPEKILQDAENIHNGVTQYYKKSLQELNSTENNTYSQEIYNKSWNTAFKQLKNSYDKKHGGFGHSPKFPIYSQLSFLIHFIKHTKTNLSEYKLAIEMLTHTLNSIQQGGIHDHLGGGFHRYTIDRAWQIPHFEKILNDQALLALIYLDASSLLNNTIYNNTVTGIFNYLNQDMAVTSQNNLYSNSQDAGLEEGIFYTWTYDELQILLEPQELDFLIIHFNIKESGNYLDERTRKYNNKNILFLSQALTEDELSEFKNIKYKLYTHRKTRHELLTDNKILTGSNILTLIAQLKADYNISEIINKTNYILENYSNNNYELAHSDNTQELFLDNYSYLVWLLLELYQVTTDNKYLELAKEYLNKSLELFWSNENNSFVYHSNRELLIQQTEIHDSVIPAGNSVMTMNLIKLNSLLNNNYNDYIEKIFASMQPSVQDYVFSHLYLLQAYKLHTNIIKITTHPLEASKLINIRKNKDNIILEYNQELNTSEYIICTNNTCQPAYKNIQDLENYLYN